MARGLCCTEEKRAIIVKLKTEGQSVTHIAKTLGCSRKLIYNAIQHFDEFGTVKSAVRAPRPRKTTSKEDNLVRLISKSDPFKSSKQIKTEIYTVYGIQVPSKTIRRRLTEGGLRGCISQKKPFVSKKNLEARLSFARAHINKPLSFWKNVLWSDESKFFRFGSDGKRYVWRPSNQQHNSRYTQKTVKHGGGNIMVWAAFSWHGVGPIVRITSKMDQFVYKNILTDHMIPFVDDHMPLRWHFMHDNDPKHTSRLVKNFLEEQCVPILQWPAQSPDLNPIENLWSEVERRMEGKKPTNLEELWQNIKSAWLNIPVERCRRLVESLPKRCSEVIKNKGFPTKY